MAKAVSLISLLFNVAFYQDIPFHQMRQLQCLDLNLFFFVLQSPFLSTKGSSRDFAELFPNSLLSWTFAVRVQWDLRAEFPVTLQNRRYPIFLRGDQKKGLH